ncbi:MAG TPA: hypothetical protein V6D17_10615 [Candidatus Obscuribacterales bacterium]
MPVFASTDELYAVMHQLWSYIKSDERMSKQLLASRLVVRFQYRDPDGSLTVDGSDGEEIRFHFGECELEPVVEMSMKSDVAHNFWLGKEPPAVALLQGRISSRGPVHKALALLPAVRPAFAVYPQLVEDLTKRESA